MTARPARYRLTDTGRTEMLPDEEPVAANTSPAIPSGDTLSLLTSLAALLADPAATKKRVGEFVDAATKARAAVDEAKKASDDRAAAEAELAEKTREHDNKLANENASHTVALQARTRDVEEREKNATAAHEAALKLLDEANAMKADLKNRLAAARKIAGE